MRYYFTIINFGFCLLLHIYGNAQVRTRIYRNDIPPEKLYAAQGRSKVVNITPPAFFNQLLNKEIPDTARLDEYKNKFAVPVAVDIDFMKQADSRSEGNHSIFTLSIAGLKSLNINIQFGEFYLSQNAILSIFNKNEITDSITAKENNRDKIWATRIYQGEKLTLVLKVPKDEININRLKINSVALGFKKAGGNFYGTPGTSEGCNINVTCAEGNGWENERNAVALIVSNSYEICTGTLIMNACGTNKPYLLTANHCLNPYLNNWVFQFQSWSSTCAPGGDYREDLQFNGCQLRATLTESETDFALVELNQVPSSNSGLAYAGWTRDTTSATQTTGVHHPMGDLMKISHDFQPPVAVAYQGGPADHWRASFDQGIIQQGSSGSALFDQDHRIIGQLHGNQYNICSSGSGYNCWCVLQVPSVAEYGRFDISWNGGGTAATRLKDWLDPSNSNAMSTNTTGINNLISFNTSSYSISGPDQFCTSANYSIQNLPAGVAVQWYVNPPSGMISYSVQDNILTINRNWDGNILIDAAVNICGTALVYHKNVHVGGDPVTLIADQLSCNEVQFIVNGAAPGSTYNWSSANNTILYNGTSTMATTTGNSIYAIATNDFALVSTTSTCFQPAGAAVPYDPFARTISGLYPEYGSCSEQVSVSVNTTPEDTYYRWYVNDILVSEGRYANSYCTCYSGNDERHSGNNIIRVDVETICNAGSSAYGEFSWYCGNYSGQSNVLLYPNPAKDQVTIRLKEIRDAAARGKLEGIKEIRITDKSGNLQGLLKYPANTRIININTSNLGLDIYFIEVSDGKNKVRIPLSVRK